MADVTTAATAEAHEAKQHHRPDPQRSTPPSHASSGPVQSHESPYPPNRMIAFETLWDAKDVAAHLKCSESWVYKHAEKGTLPCLRYGGLLRFQPDAIRKLGTRAA
jgi:hypothetical protein